MTKKTIFKRLTALALTLVTVFSVATTSLASASVFETKHTEKKITTWGYNFRNSGLPNAYDPILDSPDETSPSTYANVGYFNGSNAKYSDYFYYWLDSDGKYSYCVQFQKDNYEGSLMEAFDLDNAASYYSQKQAKYLKYATIYSYKDKTKYGYSWETELVASQCMIWCISARYFDGSTTNLGTNETKLLNCIKAPTSTDKTNLKNCFKEMKEDILNHTAIPKGVSSVKTGKPLDNSTYPLTYNTTSKKWECTVSSDSIMKNYDVATKIDGVTVTHSGNNLKFSCTDSGAKKLVGKDYITLERTKSYNGNKIEDCTPVFLATKSAYTTSQAKVSYYDNADPVNAYVAFELSTGDLKVTKKISEDGEIKDVSSYSYEYFDSDLNTNVKLTWDKAYKWESQKWVEYKNATTSNGSNFSAGLRNIIRFKVRNNAGQYVVATQNATGKWLTLRKFRCTQVATTSLKFCNT